MNKGRRLTTILLLLIFIIGLSLLLYPTISEYWNSLHQSRAIASYSEEIKNLDVAEYDKIWESAQQYNENLRLSGIGYTLNEEQQAVYESELNISGIGIMGYIEIPSIACSLPIYHGTDETILQIAIGHLEWSSLPVGGESTHCVLSGHRGLPSAKLFTNLDKLAEGDHFVLRVLDEVLTYEVDQILIVTPDDVASLGIEKGSDYCTLITCTPYGVNSHRLLVRGHRIETAEESAAVHVVANAIQIEPVVVAPIIALPILLILLICLVLKPKRR